MKSHDALRILADVSASQWGLVTSAQAAARGVDRLSLSRLAQAGDLERLAHGVYKDSGAPSDAHLDLRAAWLATSPSELAGERLKRRPSSATVSGESATRLHGVGDLRAAKSEFTLRARKQTQRADVRYRTRALTDDDVTVREGLPVTTVERTLADLVEARTDLSLVADALADATRQGGVDADRLAHLLTPLAVRNGHKKGDGDALLERLLQLAGLDREALAQRIASISGIGALVTANFLKGLSADAIAPMINTSMFPNLVSQYFTTHELPPQKPGIGLIDVDILDGWAKGFQLSLAEQLKTIDWVGLAAPTVALDRRERDSNEASA